MVYDMRLPMQSVCSCLYICNCWERVEPDFMELSVLSLVIIITIFTTTVISFNKDWCYPLLCWLALTTAGVSSNWMPLWTLNCYKTRIFISSLNVFDDSVELLVPIFLHSIHHLVFLSNHYISVDGFPHSQVKPTMLDPFDWASLHLWTTNLVAQKVHKMTDTVQKIDTSKNLLVSTFAICLIGVLSQTDYAYGMIPD